MMAKYGNYNITTYIEEKEKEKRKGTKEIKGYTIVY